VTGSMYSNLKLELWRRGIRQNRLAKILGIDETLLSRIMNGFREPDSQTRARIAAALGSNEQWLFEPSEKVTNSDDASRSNDTLLS
jgi:transcriptional regulator with XRE-family HTH domain